MMEFDVSDKNPAGPLAAPHRRTVLASVFAGAAAFKLGLAAPSAAAAPAAGSLTASDLPGGLTLISGAGANVVAAPAPGGAVLVDCGLAPHADEVMALATARTKTAKVARLFNTCWR